MDLRERVSSVPNARHDSITCNGRSIPKMAIVWNVNCEVCINQPWLKIVWHPLHIKKCSIFLWIAMQNILLTKDRMLVFGMNVHPSCVLYNNAQETVQHVFTNYPFTTQIFYNQQLHLQFDWAAYLQGNVLMGNPKNIKKYLAQLFLAVAGHTIWQEHNDRLHNTDHQLTVGTIRGKVLRMVREKVFCSAMFKKEVAKDFSLIFALYRVVCISTINMLGVSI